jgi:hypothetical protein
MSNDKSHLHPELHDASLEKACKMANALVWHNDARRHPQASRIDPGQTAFDLSYMLEYLRLNFDLVPKK